MYFNVKFLTSGRRCLSSIRSVTAVYKKAFLLASLVSWTQWNSSRVSTGDYCTRKERNFLPCNMICQLEKYFTDLFICCLHRVNPTAALPLEERGSLFPTNDLEIHVYGFLLLKLIAKFFNVKSHLFSGIIINFIWLFEKFNQECKTSTGPTSLKILKDKFCPQVQQITISVCKLVLHLCWTVTMAESDHVF